MIRDPGDSASTMWTIVGIALVIAVDALIIYSAWWEAGVRP
jgi:hypothetical protein